MERYQFAEELIGILQAVSCEAILSNQTKSRIRELCNHIEIVELEPLYQDEATNHNKISEELERAKLRIETYEQQVVNLRSIASTQAEMIKQLQKKSVPVQGEKSFTAEIEKLTKELEAKTDQCAAMERAYHNVCISRDDAQNRAKIAETRLEKIRKLIG